MFALVVLVGFSPSQAYADPPTKVNFEAILTGNSEIVPVFDGDYMYLFNVAVTANLTGDFSGIADWVVSYRVNLNDNSADTWGTAKLTMTAGLCTGTFEGVISGTSTFIPETGSFYPDKGDLNKIIGTSGTCKSHKLEKGDFEETDGVDGIFHVTAKYSK